MARRSSSPRLIGRDRELADLLEAIRRDDSERCVVLVAGEAGIGKTRLLGELIRVLGATPARGETSVGAIRVARGSCLQIGDGDLPFAPVLEFLDALRVDPALRDRVDRLRSVLAGAGDSSTTGSAVARMSRFLEIYDLLVAASERDDLVVMIDDLHWADQSTLDLVQFLARRLRGSRVLIVAAFRSDELHRRHPLRPVLAELSRGFVRARIELGPLDTDDVAAQISELGGDTTADLARRIADRAEGNPFHVEELVALDIGSGALPESLRDVLLARVATLDAGVVRVLGACAIIGRDVAEPLLALVLDLAATATFDAVATAVDRSILVPADDRGSYRFRHALLAEAIDEDLLPAARVELHRAVARALIERPDLRPSSSAVAGAELALHLDRGGERDAAIDAYLDAAALACRGVAWAEGAAAFERASELAALDTGGARADPRLLPLVTRAAMALRWSGEVTQSIALLRDWIARTETGGDVVAEVELRLTLSRVFNDIGEEGASRDMAGVAARLLPPDEHTPGGVNVLIGMSANQWIAGRHRNALDLAERSVSGAEELGDPEILVRALVQRGEALLALGHVDRGLRDFERVDRLEAEHGWLDEFGGTITNVAAALLDAGLLDASTTVWLRGLELSRAFDRVASWDPWNLSGLASCHFLTGRWPDADAPIETARAYGVPGTPTAWREAMVARLASGRGDLAAADHAIATAAANATELVGDFHALIEHARADRCSAAGDIAGRLDHLDAGIRLLDSLDDLTVRSRMAADGAGAAADLIEALHGRRDQAVIATTRERAYGYASLAADIDAGRLVPGSASTGWTRANAMLAAAETGRALGADDPEMWPSIADAFAELGMRPKEAYVRFRLAAAQLGTGDQKGAASALPEANAIATEIGMTVLSRRITELALAARIDLTAGTANTDGSATEEVGLSPASADRWGLSTRELEVLALVAEGRTNGEIGAALFISTKTASVHVTHILDKLGVSSRTEAALLASRSGLIVRAQEAAPPA